MRKTGLYFGSFNPIHIGHLIIANHLVNYSELDELWFVISPQNPLKKKGSLLADYHRLEMVKLAIDDNPQFKASDIEFKLLQPSYTIHTLTYLSEKHPDHQFYLIMGADNLTVLDKWRNYEQILEQYHICVYPRPGFDGGDFRNHPKVQWIDAPLIEISSSFIRQAIHEGKPVRYYLHPAVWKYMDEMNFYK